MSWISNIFNWILRRRPTPIPVNPPVPVSNDLAQQFVNALNPHRSQLSMPVLTLDKVLMKTAQDWANHLNATGVLTHGDFALRLNEVYPYRASGECIAEGATSGESAVNLLLADPPHRTIMLDKRYHVCGVGCSDSPIGGYFWVIDFVD